MDDDDHVRLPGGSRCLIRVGHSGGCRPLVWTNRVTATYRVRRTDAALLRGLP
jgi:hypothetical protein